MVTFSQVLTVNFFWYTNIIFISVASSSLSKKVNSTQFFCRWTFCSAAFSRFNVLLGLCLAYLHGWVQNWKPGRQFREIRGPPPHPLLLPIYALLLCLPGWISSAGQWPFYLGNLKGSFNACRTRGGTSSCWWRCDKERYQGIPSIWSTFALATGTCCHWHSRTPRSREMGEFLCAIDPFILSPNLGLLVSTTVMSVVSTTYSQCNWN